MRPGWRGLGVFWLGVLVLAGAGLGALQSMGPPRPAPAPRAAATVPATADMPGEPAHPAAPVANPWPGPPIPPHATAPGQIPAPDPALLEAAPDFPGAFLPRIGPDGRASMRVYAAPSSGQPGRPSVAVLVVGIGLDAQASRTAAETLPGAISLGISPYAQESDTLLEDIRSHGHEFLVTLPMESQGYPLDDSGPQALMTDAAPGENARRLEWALSRMQGEVGLTGASDGLLGERFAGSPTALGAVLQDAAKRGLLYVDPRPRAAVTGAAIAVTTILDDQQEPAAVNASLTQLEQQARDTGSALGLLLRPRPAAVAAVAAWANGLAGRGITLVPVSALVPKR